MKNLPKRLTLGYLLDVPTGFGVSKSIEALRQTGELTQPGSWQMHPVRVLVVEDNAFVRRSICSLLSGDSTLDVVCETADGDEAIAKAEDLLPDVVLMDIRLHGISGIEAARQIRRVSPKSRIIFLSQFDSIQIAKEAMQTGAQGYIVKSDAGQELLRGIHTVRQGEALCEPASGGQGVGASGWLKQRQALFLLAYFSKGTFLPGLFLHYFLVTLMLR